MTRSTLTVAGILHGSLAPEGAVVKSAGFDADVFEGNARVFNQEQPAMDAVLNGELKKNDVVIIRYEGPKGGPGMRGCRRSPARSRVRESARTSVDHRRSFLRWFDGAGHRPCCSRAVDGGPIAFVEDGDRSGWTSPPAPLTFWLKRLCLLSGPRMGGAGESPAQGSGHAAPEVRVRGR